MNLSILLPAYEETENLKILLPQIKENMEKHNIQNEIIVVDAMKPNDSTKNICEINSAKYVNREFGDNYGDAIRTGIKIAQNDYLLIMDADGSHSPDELKKLIDECSRHDVVIGSRYIKNGKTENNIVLIFLSWMVNVAFRFFLKIKVKDISNSLKIYRTKDIKEIELESDNFDIVEEILIKLCLKNKGYRIKEVPITFRKRKEGKSKRKLGRFILSYIYTIKKLLKISKNYSKKVE